MRKKLVPLSVSTMDKVRWRRRMPLLARQAPGLAQWREIRLRSDETHCIVPNAQQA